MEKLNLNFSGSDESQSNNGLSSDQEFDGSDNNKTSDEDDLTFLNKNPKDETQVNTNFRGKISVEKKGFPSKSKMREIISARYQNFYNESKNLHKQSTSFIKKYNRDSVVVSNKKLKSKGSNSSKYDSFSERANSNNMNDAYRQDSIELYRKRLLSSMTVRRTSNRYRLYYFIQFWIIFTFTIFINIFACILIILEDMYRDHEEVWDVFELILMVYFMVEFVVSIFLYKPPRYKMLLDWGTYIDIITILPRLIMLIFNKSNVSKLGFFRILRMFKIFRIMRILKFLRKIKSKRSTDELSYERPAMSPLTNQIMILIVSLLSTLFISAGFLIFIDEEIQDSWNFNINYIDAIYYIVVTGSTLGYGDIHPIKAVSRFTIISVIFIIIYIFAKQINKIISTINQLDSYDTKMHLKNHAVIFLYNDNIEILTSFLLYYLRYENAHSNSAQLGNSKILLICDRQKGISPEIKQYMSINLFRGRLRYIPSKKAVDKRLIDRGRLKYAREIYFLSDSRDEHSSNIDKMSIIYAHFLKNHGVSCNIYIQNSIEHQDFRDWTEVDNRLTIPSSIGGTS